MSQQKFANRLRGRRGGGRAGGWLELKSFSFSQLEHTVCVHIIQQKLLPCVFVFVLLSVVLNSLGPHRPRGPRRADGSEEELEESRREF